jgi:signal transduction histidine kinase/DNA-binding response OmpR family regulator
MFLDRHGYLEETFFTFSFSPIRDETGGVGGVLNPCHETTARMLSERRTRALRDLSARTGKAKSVEEVLVLSAQTLTDYDLDVPFLLLYARDSSGQQARLIAGTGLKAGAEACPDVLDLEESARSFWPVAEVFRSGSPAQVDDIGQRLGPPPYGPYPEPPRTALLLPTISPGAELPAVVLVAGVSPRLPLNEAYSNFYDLLAAGVTAAIANARAFEEERKRSEALAEIDRAKTAFFSNVSHEFRTPLTLMLGPVEDMLSRSYTELSPAAKGQLEVVNRNGLRLLRLVNTLLDFSRIEAGRVRALYQRTDLSSFTCDLASMFRSACERAGLTLSVDCPPLTEPAYVDRDMWEKIVLNLLSNAFKFTFEGTIAVTLRQVDDRAELVVRDSGTGIPTDQMPHLFERFHRVTNARGRTHEGSGIGLALVQELVRLHGGTIRAHSVYEHGTTFTVTIPLDCDHLPPEQISQDRTPASTAPGASPYVDEALRWLPESPDDAVSKAPQLARADVMAVPYRSADDGDVPDTRPHVLVADDNADMREYVARLLAERYHVEAVADGAAAIEAIRTCKPDLVLTDVMMPRLDGLSLLREIRADETLRETPVIMLSARAGEESRIEGIEGGADDYLVKPFSARELVARVDAHLKMARLRAAAEKRVRESQAQLAVELADTQQLQRLSSRLIEEDDIDALYGQILEAACAVMRSETASLQVLVPERNELLLLAHRGLAPASAAYWKWVRLDDANSCAIAMSRNERVVVADVEACDLIAGTEDLAQYRLSGIRTTQSTPLVSRNGRLVGMISTHWRKVYEPSEREWRVLDVLARQAADLIERRTGEQALRESEAALREREVWLAAQKEALQAVVSGASLEASLGILVRTAVEQWGTDSRCAFYVADADGAGLHHVTGMPESSAECVDGLETAPDSLACCLAVYTGQPVITVDVTKEPAWKSWLWLADRYRFRGCWSFPIETVAGKVVGTFAIYFDSAREATPRDYALAAVLTRTAAIIISRHQEAEERARAVESLRDSELALRRALAEREALLKELHHRVKNNLQVIMSLLEMQAETAAHQEALSSFAEARSRVAAIAAMHELLYQSESFSEIDLTSYARRLVTHVVALYQKGSRVNVFVIGNGIRVDLARAVPLGLLLNELVSNACKHAFPGATEGRLEIRLHEADSGIHVQVTDTGVGLPAGLNHRTSGTLGLQLVHMLAKQLGGDVRFESVGGTTVDVHVPRRPSNG